MVKITFVVIDKSNPNRTWAGEFPVNYTAAYSYFINGNTTVLNAAKVLLDVPVGVRTVDFAYADYLIHPESGEILLGEDTAIDDLPGYFKRQRDKFNATVEAKRRELAAEAAYKRLPKIHIIM